MQKPRPKRFARASAAFAHCCCMASATNGACVEDNLPQLFGCEGSCKKRKSCVGAACRLMVARCECRPSPQKAVCLLAADNQQVTMPQCTSVTPMDKLAALQGSNAQGTLSRLVTCICGHAGCPGCARLCILTPQCKLGRWAAEAHHSIANREADSSAGLLKLESEQVLAAAHIPELD